MKFLFINVVGSDTDFGLSYSDSRTGKIYILEENICPIQLSFSCYISLLISNIRSASETEPDSIIKDAKNPGPTSHS